MATKEQIVEAEKVLVQALFARAAAGEAMGDAIQLIVHKFTSVLIDLYGFNSVTDFAALIDMLNERFIVPAKAVAPLPVVGDGATLCIGSDRYACTVTYVSKTGHKILVQQDTAIRTDDHYQHGPQEYRYERNPQGRVWAAFKHKHGGYQAADHLPVTIGTRCAYYDYSF